jgi:hypothetical protein
MHPIRSLTLIELMVKMKRAAIPERNSRPFCPGVVFSARDYIVRSNE